MEITRVVVKGDGYSERIYVDGVRLDIAAKEGKLTSSVKAIAPCNTGPQFPERLQETTLLETL